VKLRKQLLIFTRYPERGKTKTRLIPLLGEDGATELHRRMTEYTIRKLQDSSSTLSLVIYYDGGTEEKMRSWLGSHLSYRLQQGEDLGQRMQTACEASFASGETAIAIIGTDCPDLSATLILEAFDRLGNSDLVLGPASDGGYYLIALKHLFPELFEAIDWGTSRVLETTQAIAARLNLSVAYLPELADVDRPADLARSENWPIDLRLHDDGGSDLDEIE
jgi:rSAM/selenodomain-associated transferase 1